MADQTNSFQNERVGPFDSVSSAAAQVRADVERLVEGFDLNAIAKRVEDFGRENPIGLAITAVTLGIAAGMMLRAPRHLRAVRK